MSNDRRDAQPIGVFDSGVGGLSVLLELQKQLPHEHLLYLGDSGHAPYGDRPVEWIQQRSGALAEQLIARGVKALVVACNTATTLAVASLRARFTLPIIAIEPAIKVGVLASQRRHVAVLATTRTLGSESFDKLRATHADGVEVLLQPCPGLADLVEQGEVTGPAAEALLQRFLRPVLEAGADTIVLGCTHYSFLAPLIRTLVGPAVVVVDPAAAVARQVGRRLEAAGLLSSSTATGRVSALTTGSVEHSRRVMALLLSQDLVVDALE